MGHRIDTSRRSEPEPRKQPAWNRRAALLAATMIVSGGLGSAGAGRAADCRDNVMHMAPSRAMLADALGQYLAWKRWPRVFLVVGTRDGDGLFAEALRRAAKRFGNKIVEVEKYLLVGQRVWQLAFAPDESLLFTTNGVSNDVSVIDVARLKVVKSIAVGRFPWGLTVSKD